MGKERDVLEEEAEVLENSPWMKLLYGEFMGLSLCFEANRQLSNFFVFEI